jgi:hypothetical protein
MTAEEKEKFFQAILVHEKDPEERRRMIKLWHKGKIKIWKRLGKIRIQVPPERVLLPCFGGEIRSATMEEWERGESGVLLRDVPKKSKEIVEGEGKLIYLDDARQTENV